MVADDEGHPPYLLLLLNEQNNLEFKLRILKGTVKDIYTFEYNFDTVLYWFLETGTSDRSLICIVQRLRFSGFSLYPLSFFLYSPSKFQYSQFQYFWSLRPNLMNLNYVAELLSAGLTKLSFCFKFRLFYPYIVATLCRRPLNHRFKVKDSARFWIGDSILIQW